MRWGGRDLNLAVTGWKRRTLCKSEPGADRCCTLGGDMAMAGSQERCMGAPGDGDGRIREGQRNPLSCSPGSSSVISPGVGDVQVAPHVPSNSPQEWSGTSSWGQYPSKRNYFLMGFKMTNHIHPMLKSQSSSKGESYIWRKSIKQFRLIEFSG